MDRNLQGQPQENARAQDGSNLAAPVISLPKGGGAVRGIGEKFGANPVTGTASMTVPIATSPGRSGFGPQLALAYDSGSGNGPFGFGWSLSLPNITRKTSKGLPMYRDTDESDTFLLTGAEDLVPVLNDHGARWRRHQHMDGSTYLVQRYRPRIEGLFARIERWTNTGTGEAHWRSISRDNVTTVYGKTPESRIVSPSDARRIFSWLICESYDDKGNAIAYEYASENGENVDRRQPSERNRERTANRYLKRIRYGNRESRLIQPDLTAARWLFEVVLDYDEGHYHELDLDPDKPADAQHQRVRAGDSPGQPWAARPDPFSTYNAGFEMRTYRRCRRALMFHHFDELGSEPCLVRSTDFDYSDLNYSRPVPVEAELAHQGSTRFASFIRSVSQSGYTRQTDGTYTRKSLPPLEFVYSKATIQEEIHEVDAGNLPVGLDSTRYRWVDLDGEGVSGILTEQAGAWFYKANLGDARFGPLQVVERTPSLAALSAGRQQLLDLAGDGQLDLVDFTAPSPGFYERTHDEDWQPFKPFRSLPSISWGDPNLRFVDLDGDGHADVLITEQHVFTWYASLAEDGFGPARRVHQALDEERGPRLVFSDSAQSIYLADMSGDGLTDLARVRNGEVCYWPNLGHGRFGAKVTMDNSPWFDNPDLFNQQRVRLADIDGSGTNDIIYLGGDGVRLYFNESGNRWSEPRRLRAFPPVDNLSAVTTADLLGNGTACLVWSSPLPGDARRPLRYIDLMGGRKPHLLVTTINNLGAETHVHYVSSTTFYLADKAQGRPWITKLPFPVHVVERVESHDRISRNRFVTRYAYHHGYFDGIEREFRGFGLVEQWDTESFAVLSASDEFPDADNIDAASHVPPVLTRTWFHTGVYRGRDHVSDFFAGLVDEDDQGEYYREPGLTDAEAQRLLLDDTALPEGLSVADEREACRSLKGSMLRQEVYALDGTDKESHPYTVTEQNFTIKVLQPRGPNRHMVFLTHAHETISYHYERNPADPRVTHSLTLEVDEFGNVLKQAAIGYGRRSMVRGLNAFGEPALVPNPGLSRLEPRDQDKQTQMLITYTESRVTNHVDSNDDYRTPLPCESRTYELTGLTPPGDNGRLTLAGVLTMAAGAESISYEKTPAPGRAQKRLIEHVRTLYRRDDLAGPLPLGELQPLALPFESYQMAFTPGLVTTVYGDRVTDEMLETGGRYVHSEGDANWWIPSGRMFFSPGSADTPEQEHDHALGHFFLPRRYRDPFHTDEVSTESRVTYDHYDLLMLETSDALDNRVTSGERDADGNLTVPGIDYRVLQPRLLMDPNRNRSQVAFDALGMVVGTAVMGKPEENLGDTLSGFDPNLTDAVILDHLAGPLDDPHAILNDATSRLVYDLHAYYRAKELPDPQPGTVYTLTRETHAADLEPGEQTMVQHSFSYSDGFGREIQQKVRAEPGPAPRRDPDGKVVLGDAGQPEMAPGAADPRWAGSSWTVFNNKEKPVREYEPFFTNTHRFEFDMRIGVSPIVFYDPTGRVVATLRPNHTWEKVIFDPWHQETWDVSDTLLIANPGTDPDIGDYLRRLAHADYLPTWYSQRVDGQLGTLERSAARKAAIHAETPSRAYADSLGRAFLSVAHNRFEYSNSPANDSPVEEFHASRTILDIEGNEREVIDAKDRVVMRYDYDMLGNRLHQTSMEAGERWTFTDAGGNPARAWDSRNHQFRTVYDPLRRPAESYLREDAGPDVLVERTVYGESWPDAEARNLRTQAVQVFDQAGSATSDDYDFKGNLLRSRRTLAREYKATLDWTGPVPLEAEPYSNRTRYDALDRPVELTAPDNSVIRPHYNEANLLDRVEANLQGARQNGDLTWTAFVTNIDYDAKGQRTRIRYGNGVRTSYTYDPLTFRLMHVLTRRNVADFPADCPQPPPVMWPGCHVQNLHYTYDPSGNITHIRDDAQQTIFFRNKRVEPAAGYTYDALYRLIEATGREHLGQTSGAPASPTESDAFNRFQPRLDHPGDGNALGAYLERYIYDAVGNVLEMQHRGSDPVHSGWTRRYGYQEASLLEPEKHNNQLSSTTVGNGTPEGYRYDAHGNVTVMPHLSLMQWDYLDQLQVTAQQVVGNNGTPESTWYVYGAGGQRMRKVTERQSVAGQSPTRKAQRIYLGDFEIYREYSTNGDKVELERESLHIMNDQQRVALVETRTQGDEPAPEQLIRFQLSNHIGSTSLELDDRARIISYEEYAPYGTTTFQATRSRTETPKRYRYTGKERDDESGLYYHGARYYAPWLARWTSSDPAGMVDGPNLYPYARNNPVMNTDSTGAYCDPTAQSCVDPTIPTAREEALQQSLPEDERYLPAASFPEPEPEPLQAQPAQPVRSPGRVIAAPPPVSPTDTTLYVEQGFAYTQYEAAGREVDNPDNPWYTRAGFFALGVLVSPVALAEEYVARPVTNIPFVVHNAGIGIGEHTGRAYLWQQQGETGEAIVSGLEATVAASTGFVAGASVGVPVAGAIEARAAQATMATTTTRTVAAESAVQRTSGGTANRFQFERLRAELARQELMTAEPVGSALKGAGPFSPRTFGSRIDLSHASPTFARDLVSRGQHFTIRGGDGVYRNLTQVPGEVNGVRGIFEYIVGPRGLTHQRFIPGGRITGFPNQ